VSGTGDRKRGAVTYDDGTRGDRRRGHGGERTGIGGEVGRGASVHDPFSGGCLEPHCLELVHQRVLIPRGRRWC
jgi:hypothetical protein